MADSLRAAMVERVNPVARRPMPSSPVARLPRHMPLSGTKPIRDVPQFSQLARALSSQDAAIAAYPFSPAKHLVDVRA